MQGYEAKMAERLNGWKADIDALAVKTRNVRAQNLIEFERQLDLLFAKHNLAQEKLAELDQVGEVEQEELRASLDGVCNEIENALDSAWAKID